MKYSADWDSLRRHRPVPAWFPGLKFGIYFHWGVYAVPAYGNEHYYRHMHDLPHGKNGIHARHVALYGPLERFGYHDFIPRFTGERFDAVEWAELFQKAGARFAGPVAEHHDGFAMWGSRLTPFNSLDMGPRRDVVAEMGRALRKRGLRFITTFHHELNWGYVAPQPGWAAADPRYARLYGTPMPHEEWLSMWRDKLIEVVDAHLPDMTYHDAWLKKIPERHLMEYLAHYFNRAEEKGREVAVFYKNDDLPPGIGMLDVENRTVEAPRPEPFLVDLPIGTSAIYAWGYTEGMVVRSAEEVLSFLLDVVSKNGALMLNLSPRADGTIPEDQRRALHRIGLWLWSFGEAVYDTTVFPRCGEEADVGDGRTVPVRYTRRGPTVYAIVVGEIPPRRTMVLSALNAGTLGSAVGTVEALFSREPVPARWKMTERGLHVDTPESRIPSEMASVYRVTLSR